VLGAFGRALRLIVIIVISMTVFLIGIPMLNAYIEERNAEPEPYDLDTTALLVS